MTAALRTPRRGTTGIVAVATTYVFFLIFAQFSFLAQLKSVLDSSQVRLAMGAMGIAGLLMSLATAPLVQRFGTRRVLIGAYLSCSGVAAASSFFHTLSTLAPIAALIGASTAAITVSLAGDLVRLIGPYRFGLKTGVGTGLAYFVCNIPAIFEASVIHRSLFAAAVTVFGAIVVAFDRDAFAEPGPAIAARVPESSVLWPGFLSVVLSFLALIWFDSAAFAIIQETALKSETWATPGQKLLMGTTHFAAAVIAGYAIDRLALGSLLPVAFALFAAAFAVISGAPWMSGLAGPLYAVGISLYSTALVAFPSARSDAPGTIPSRWRAAILYGVAGWLGSALGVGMALDLGTVPAAFIAVAGAVIVLGWLLARPRLLRPLAAAAGVPALLAIGGFIASLAPISMPADPVERGHIVYLSEGCVNCHSQYVRPGNRDEMPWGPYRGLDREAQPPIPGNRRQGPDLQNVGNRRGARWQRLHLIDPSSLVPTSRMPSYSHLFAEGSSRGDDLVAYLRSLGAETTPARMETIAAYPMAEGNLSGDPVHGAALYTRHCAQCHGQHGYGDGPLLKDDPTEPRDLLKDKWWFVGGSSPDDSEPVALARVVRYGLPGLTMPGHETWTARDVSDVVAWVQAMRSHARRHRVAERHR